MYGNTFSFPGARPTNPGASGCHLTRAVTWLERLMLRRRSGFPQPPPSEMAAPVGGMFSGQPPGHPLPPPGLPGQASLLQATPGAPRSSPSTLVDELESSFEVK